MEVICCLPKVQAFLKSVKQFIDAELAKRSMEVKCNGDEDSPGDVATLQPSPEVCSICVCICCSTGTHVSPSCVERLYEVYTNTPTPSGQLVVRREHKQATAWAMKQIKHNNLLWQRTKMPVKYFRSVKELTYERMWRPLPVDLLPLIEEQFQRDPFNIMCKLHQGKNNHELNFVTGEIYSIHEMKTYRLRCTLVRTIQDCISCSMLNGAPYKSKARHYGAAGILFYAYHTITGEPVFLLGHMTYSCESWCDFGGLKSFRYDLFTVGMQHSTTCPCC